MKRELTIIGGGLAGLSLGIALRRRDVPVRLIEASTYPRHRVCGEFISGMTENELDALGLREIFSCASRPRTTAWFDNGRQLLRRNLPNPAYGLSRHRLDAALAEKFCALGGDLVCGQREDRVGEGIVAASGRVKGKSPWIGLKAHYEGLQLEADLEIHLQARGYIGLTQIENGRVNVCGLFRRTHALQARGNALEAALEGAGFLDLATRLHGARAVAESLKGISHFSLGWQREREDGAVRVGDRAALIPPFTGNGMAMAFQSALAAAEPLTRWSEGGDWEGAAREIRVESRKRFSRRIAWARALQAILMHRLGRGVARLLIAFRVVRFESLYHLVR